MIYFFLNIPLTLYHFYSTELSFALTERWDGFFDVSRQGLA